MILLTWLGAIVVLVAFAALSRLRVPPEHRRRGVRIACAAIGVLLLAATATVTIRDARAAYSQPESFDLRLPTMKSPASTKGRFLLHLMLAEAGDGIVRVIQGRSFELRLPEDANRTFEGRLQRGTASVDYEAALRELWLDESSGALRAIANYRLRTHDLDTNSMGSGGIEIPGVQSVLLSELRSPFTLHAHIRPSLVVLYDFSPIRDGDPLRAATPDEVLAQRGRGAWDRWADLKRHGIREISFHAPAYALLEHLGLAGVALLAAAILFAQLFRRRSLGFARALACMILFAAAMDAVVLRIHASHLRNGQAKEEERLSACAHVGSTFFFEKSARAALEAVAKDPAAPESLRRRATFGLRTP